MFFARQDIDSLDQLIFAGEIRLKRHKRQHFELQMHLRWMAINVIYGDTKHLVDGHP